MFINRKNVDCGRKENRNQDDFTITGTCSSSCRKMEVEDLKICSLQMPQRHVLVKPLCAQLAQCKLSAGILSVVLASYHYLGT